MLYYRVRPEYDNKPRTKRGRAGVLKYDGIYIGGELFTSKEVEREYNSHVVRIARDQLFEPVNVSRKSIYWFFGARFSTELKKEA